MLNSYLWYYKVNRLGGKKKVDYNRKFKHWYTVDLSDYDMFWRTLSKEKLFGWGVRPFSHFLLNYKRKTTGWRIQGWQIWWFPKKRKWTVFHLKYNLLHTFRNIPPDNEANSIENFKSEIEIQLTEKGLIWPQISYRNAQTWKKNAWSIL